MRRGAVILCCLLPGLPAGATDFCAEITRLLTDRDSWAGTLELAGAQATCRTALSLEGTQSLHCGWGFDYRAPAAQAQFDAGLAALSDCLGEDAAVQPDQMVNHPDFYDQRVYTTPSGELGLSLKDKAALGQSFVFLRIAPKG